MNQELEQLQTVYNTLVEFFITYSFQLLGAIIILLTGLLLASRVAKYVEKVCLKHKLDITLSRFVASVSKIVIITAVAIVVLNNIGISITPFIAAVGAISLGAGLAVQGLLTNYSVGLNIILTRPYVIGDTISVQGVTGIVTEVRLAYTILSDEDNVTITIPNRHVIGEILQNSGPWRLVEAQVGVAYHSNIDQVKSIISEVLEHQNLTEHQPAQIGIDEFADSAITIGFRYWAPTGQYHQVRFKVNDQVFAALNGAGVNIPFPQREITVRHSDQNPGN